MSRVVLALLSFLLGVGIGAIIMSCVAISKECDKYEEESKYDKR